MKVTLIYAGIGVAGFNSDRPLGDREGSWISHGLASVGASAKAAGHEVDLIDLRQLEGWDSLKEKIRVNPAEVYGISISPVDYYAGLKSIEVVKTTVPQAKIVIGGIHPTVFSEDYDFKVIDAIVSGEGEITFRKLLGMIERGEPLPGIMRGERPNLDELPFADRELFDYPRELSCFFAPGQELPSLTMLAGRGCPYHCAYCQPAENAVFGSPYRIRSPANVVTELINLKIRYDFKSVTFWDDTFTFNPNWVESFCHLYRKMKIRAEIAACSRADIICNNEEMVRDLAATGLRWFVIGFESGSQRILNLINKGTTVEQNKEAAKLCKRYDIKIFATYMYGLPTETNEEILNTARMIDEIEPDHISPFWYRPIRGTRLYDYCEQKDMLLDTMKPETIARTGVFTPSIKGVDYQFITNVMNGER